MAIAAITQNIGYAFRARTPHRRGAGLATDGTTLTLYGNRIAWWDGPHLWIQVNGFPNPCYHANDWRPNPKYAAGNFGTSPTTLAKLARVTGLAVYRHRNRLMLNGRPWDGLPTIALTQTPEHSA